jgi:hypothetical protein
MSMIKQKVGRSTGKHKSRKRPSWEAEELSDINKNWQRPKVGEFTGGGKEHGNLPREAKRAISTKRI